MKNFTGEALENLKKSLNEPVGTVSLKYTFDNDLFDQKIPIGIIFDIVSGVHYFRLERTNNLDINFYHSSPGTGTRVATINLKLVQPCKKMHFIFSWSTKEIKLYMGPMIENGKLISATGVKSDKDFQIDKDGNVVQIGDKGIEIMGLRMNINDQQILKPPAINVWKGIIIATEILQSGKSEKGYIFDTVKANFSIVMLVTGFESYCKTRFEELNKEGMIIDLGSSIDKKLEIEKILDPKTNCFQDYKVAKKIYNLAFKINFDKIVTDPNDLETLKMVIKFRHRIVHVDPLLAIINEFDIPRIKPRFSTNEIVSITHIFNEFIERLHLQTLSIMKGGQD